MAQGLEETAALALVKPPGGALVSGLGDIGGFRHTSLTEVPAMMHTQPVHGSTTGLDYAELNPDWLVRVGDAEGSRTSRTPATAAPAGGPAPIPGGVSGGGSVALNADATAVVWSPEGAGVHYSTQCRWLVQPVPAASRPGRRSPRDRVDPDRFYAYADGTVYVSTDRGRTFTAAATGLPDAGLRPPQGGAGPRRTRLVRRGERPAALHRRWGHLHQRGRIDVGLQRRASARRRRAATHPAVYAVATIGGVTGRLPLRRHRRHLGADQRRRAPVGQHGRGADRRPGRLRPGLPGHQRSRGALR